MWFNFLSNVVFVLFLVIFKFLFNKMLFGILLNNFFIDFVLIVCNIFCLFFLVKGI